MMDKNRQDLCFTELIAWRKDNYQKGITHTKRVIPDEVGIM